MSLLELYYQKQLTTLMEAVICGKVTTTRLFKPRLLRIRQHLFQSVVSSENLEALLKVPLFIHNDKVMSCKAKNVYLSISTMHGGSES